MTKLELLKSHIHKEVCITTKDDKKLIGVLTRLEYGNNMQIPDQFIGILHQDVTKSNVYWEIPEEDIQDITEVLESENGKEIELIQIDPNDIEETEES